MADIFLYLTLFFLNNHPNLYARIKIIGKFAFISDHKIDISLNSLGDLSNFNMIYFLNFNDISAHLPCE